MFEDLGIDPAIFSGVQLYRGRGCDRCKNSGYAGRMAIIEAMTITDQIRKLIIARANTRELARWPSARECARSAWSDSTARARASRRWNKCS